jgi:CheY-like chemotaxis protein
MPEMTGREVAEAVKAAAPSLPVVLLTGWGDQVAETESALPVDRILGKPIRLNDLLAVIAELTGPTGA